MGGLGLVFLIAQAHENVLRGSNSLGATLAGAVLMHRGESECPSEAQATQYGDQKLVRRYLLRTASPLDRIEHFDLQMKTSESESRPGTLGNRVSRD